MSRARGYIGGLERPSQFFLAKLSHSLSEEWQSGDTGATRAELKQMTVPSIARGCEVQPLTGPGVSLFLPLLSGACLGAEQ